VAFVRFTDAAVGDLQTLQKRDPQIVRQVLKKCLLLERDPHAGEPLLGDLIGYRKLVVGNRDWRIVWRVTEDVAGDVMIDVAEVWAAGARSDGEVYAEMTERISVAPASPLTAALAEIVTILAPGQSIEARSEPQADPVPDWLRDRLVHTAGLSPAEVDQLTGARAADRWDAYMRGSR
jgi:mRNA interferase RelE/StbE